MCPRSIMLNTMNRSQQLALRVMDTGGKAGLQAPACHLLLPIPTAVTAQTVSTGQNRVTHYPLLPPSLATSQPSTATSTQTPSSNQVIIPKLTPDFHNTLSKLRNTTHSATIGPRPLVSKLRYFPCHPSESRQSEPLPRYELIESSAERDGRTVSEASIRQKSYSWDYPNMEHLSTSEDRERGRENSDTEWYHQGRTNHRHNHEHQNRRLQELINGGEAAVIEIDLGEAHNSHVSPPTAAERNGWQQRNFELVIRCRLFQRCWCLKGRYKAKTIVRGLTVST